MNVKEVIGFLGFAAGSEGDRDTLFFERRKNLYL